MPQHALRGLAQAAGSQELLPHTASGFGFDLEGEIPRHRSDWHRPAHCPLARQPLAPGARGSRAQPGPFGPSGTAPSPPNLPIAKVLYLLDVAMVTQAGASCRHPGGRCFPLPGRARAGGDRHAPRPLFRVSGEAGSRNLPWAPWQRSVPPSDLPAPHEHTPRERSGFGAPTRTCVGPQRPPARGTGDGAGVGAAQARSPPESRGTAGAPGSCGRIWLGAGVGDSSQVPCAPVSRCGRGDAAEGTLRTRGRSASAAAPAGAPRGRER